MDVRQGDGSDGDQAGHLSVGVGVVVDVDVTIRAGSCEVLALRVERDSLHLAFVRLKLARLARIRDVDDLNGAVLGSHGEQVITG